MNRLCDDDAMKALVEAMTIEPNGQLSRIDELLASYPEDARLHFLRGSNLIGAGRLIEGHGSLSRAVEIAPDFAIARFQLGLFQLTSGEADNALETFGRLDRLPDGHYLRRFVDGLRCLIRDDFLGAIDNLQQGIRINAENPPLNNDMQMLIDLCLPLISQVADDAAETPISEASLILKQFSDRRNMN